jgi:streptogramin lyase
MTALAIGPDGTVWVMGDDWDKHCPDIEDEACHGTVLFRLEDDGSLTTIEDWSDVYDGEPERFQLAVSPDGNVWLVGALRHRLQGAELLLRFDGEGWEAIPGPEGWDPGTRGRYLDVGPDGALWVKARAAGDLARFDDRGWATFTEADGVKRWDEKGSSFTDLLEVAADGSVWLNGSPTDEGCGVTHYHGTTWTSYLAGSCIEDFAIAPDGSVWLGAAEGSRLHVYVITPEAVAATEW